MAENSAQEKTEDATPRRRQEARRKGTVARSQDLNGALVLLALIMVLPAAVGHMASGFMQSIHVGLGQIPMTVQEGTIGSYTWSVMQPSLAGLAMLVAVAMGVGVAANFAQVGFTMSGEALMPSFSKINPLNGFKRLFSWTATFEGMKAVAKSVLFGIVAYTVIRNSWTDLMGLSYLPASAAISKVGSIMHVIFVRIAMLWLVLAAIDTYFQRKQIDKQLKMTKEEIKQEMKEGEASPELRGAQARRRRQLSKGRMMDAVRTADVIITNPTHFSVAIKYDSAKQHAPQVVAKGQDFLAFKIREVAGENKVPIIPNPPLARALYKQCEIGDFIPGELFQPVAEVLAYVYRTIKKVRI